MMFCWQVSVYLNRTRVEVSRASDTGAPRVSEGIQVTIDRGIYIGSAECLLVFVSGHTRHGWVRSFADCASMFEAA
jgi:hypothetical protein